MTKAQIKRLTRPPSAFCRLRQLVVSGVHNMVSRVANLLLPAGLDGLVQRPFAADEWKLSSVKAKRIVFVASTGGHLTQLVRLSDTLVIHPDSVWVTFDSEQSRSLLKGRNILRVSYVRPRDYFGVFRTFLYTFRRLRKVQFDACISTGAAVALGVLPWARLRGIPCIYVESVSRADGPSFTGHLVEKLRLAHTFTQHREWTGKRWPLHASVLSAFKTVERQSSKPPGSPLKVFVSLGTIKPYRFDSIVDALLRSGVVNDQTIWQLGETARAGLPGRSYGVLPTDVFEGYSKAADVVITHAGVGNILNLLEMGIHPVVVPRRKERNEHVDNHQLQICRVLKSAQVAIVCEADSLTPAVFYAAARHKTAAR
jgi:UDP-N-acetylglucosamine--N-acetylmuramyl-(pentapeptide) pyrophosphoryl-undecaprenol N-acetylglucosamine transferase